MSVGEWIVRHRAVPYVEPFAWTRAGEPYYAYAWPWQTIYFLALRAGGPDALHLLAAAVGAGVVLSGAMAGRALGLRHANATLFAMLSAMVALESTPFLRPQLAMHVIVLLTWACVARIADADAPTTRQLFALFALAAISANTQITFPVLAAPLSLLLVRERIGARSLAPAVVALTLGWMTTPYLLTWVGLVARLSSGITSHHPMVGELKAGFSVAPVVGAFLAVLPIAAAPRLRTAAQRLVYGGMWLVGLLVFTRYFKGIGPWWWCAIPLCVMALDQIPAPSTAPIERVMAALLAAIMFASSISSVRLFVALRPLEGVELHGSLPSVKAFAAEPAVRWLEQSIRPGATGKLLTVFSYGSYLHWRLPTLSPSIDSRGGIFPDSAALPDVELRRGAVPLGPWKSSDVAIVPADYPVARVLDADPAWQRIGICVAPPWGGAESRATLWVRREWWQRVSRPGAKAPVDSILSL
jgi:hypothetical protein